jgi:hypothetical protein
MISPPSLLSKEDFYRGLIRNTLEVRVVDSDLALVAFVLFLVIAAMLFPGGPGTPRRMRAEM